jgi:cell division protein FtsW
LRTETGKSSALTGVDRKMLYAVIVLVALGLVMVTSASQIIAHERFRSAYFFMQQHIVRIALGGCMLLLFMKIDFKRYQRLAPWLLAATFILLIALFIWGIRVRGAIRWLRIYKFNMQPVEIAKLTLIIFLASKLADPRFRIGEFKRGFLPLLVICVAMAIIVALQPNFSNAAFIVGISFMIMFIGGCRLHHIALSGLTLAAVSVPFLWKQEHILTRLNVLLGGSRDTLGARYHIDQSLIAHGVGYIGGRGIGDGLQKFHFLPDAHTDFIYSIIGEEMGLIGTVFVLALFVLILVRAMRNAHRAPNDFGYLLSLGFGLSLFMSAVINMAMTLGIFPVVGLPLPFISFGGTSLVTSLVMVGILLNISSQGKEGGFRRVKPAARKMRKKRVYAVRSRYARRRT